MHIHVPFIMYCSKLFVVVFQEINCLHTFKHDNVRRDVTELHLSTKFHICQYCSYEIRELNQNKKKNSEIGYFHLSWDNLPIFKII